MQLPNIVYIHSHDTGRYVQPYGHAIDTPNIQRFAEQGVLFRQAFCAGPTCSPSRAGLLTGQSPHSAGMVGLAHRGFALNDPTQHLATTLRRAGYRTALMGVQHVIDKDNWAKLGYDEFPGEGKERDDAHTRAARWLDERSDDKPFFLDCGFFLTHRTGKHAGRNSYHNHAESPLGDPRYIRPPAPLPDTPQTRQDMADFMVAARRYDDRVGSILDQLDKHGLRDNTLVILTTDHGIAFPGMKCSLTDHGMGVLLMMRGPAGFSGGKVVDGMVSHIDIYPTLCDVLGIDRPRWLQGQSVLPLVKGEQAELHDAVFGEVTYHAAYEPKRAVRTTRYKYIRHFGGRGKGVMPNCDDSVSKTLRVDAGWRDRPVAEERLYDLLFDPVEACNRVDDADYAEALADMRSRLDTWMRDTNDPLLKGPVPLPAGAFSNDVNDMSPT